jgi:hypothetical protein
MHCVRTLILTLLVVVSLFLSSGVAWASDRVLQVINVSIAPEHVDEYVVQIERLLGVQERLRTDGKMRMWRSTIPASGAVTVIVSIEYDDLNAFATNYTRLQADPEWQEIMKGLPAIRKLLSSSLYTEITPQ